MIRELIIPDPGKILLQADQSGAEALIVAWLCRNGKFRSLFQHGIKPHTYAAFKIFKDHWKTLSKAVDEIDNLPIDQLSSSPEWKTLSSLIAADEMRYYVGKKTVHMFNYDAKAPTFQMAVLLDTNGKLVLSTKECNHFRAIHFDTFPEIPEWHMEIRDIVSRTHILKNLFGYPRLFTARIGEDLWKKAYAFIPQSTVGTITNIAITNIQNDLEHSWHKSVGLDILQNGHDSILVQCNIGYEERTKLILKEALEQDLISPRGEKFKMKAEIAVGENWGNMKKI